MGDLSATHVTNESDIPESITWLYFKSCNAHFSVHYLDIAHFTKTNGHFGWVTLNNFTPVLCIMGLVHKGNVVTAEGGIMHKLKKTGK